MVAGCWICVKQEPTERTEFLYLVWFEDFSAATFAHEIVHPLVEKNLKERSPWAKEGVPTFSERFYGYWKDNELSLR